MTNDGRPIEGWRSAVERELGFVRGFVCTLLCSPSCLLFVFTLPFSLLGLWPSGGVGCGRMFQDSTSAGSWCGKRREQTSHPICSHCKQQCLGWEPSSYNLAF